MIDTSYNQNTEINSGVVNEEAVPSLPETFPENNAYSKLRRIALISTIILILLILAYLLYLNGKSLYEHGL
ncbi:TPA: hypothetical protein DEP94_02470 [Candidatus Nomurabacteria bacterium]|nr:hypothetical protein [Candidatus Nomurabacteria bacterium]